MCYAAFFKINSAIHQLCYTFKHWARFSGQTQDSSSCCPVSFYDGLRFDGVIFMGSTKRHILKIQKKLAKSDSLREKAACLDIFQQRPEMLDMSDTLLSAQSIISTLQQIDPQKAEDTQLALDAHFILIDALKSIKDNNEEFKKSKLYVNYLEGFIVELDQLDVSFEKLTLLDDEHKNKIESAFNKGKQRGEISVRQSGTDGNKKKKADKVSLTIPVALELLNKPHDIHFHPEDYRTTTLAIQIINKLNKSGQSGWSIATISGYIKQAVQFGQLKEYQFLLGSKPKKR